MGRSLLAVILLAALCAGQAAGGARVAGVAGRGSSNNERNGWGKWADGWVGKGAQPSLANRPVQSWLHRFMYDIGHSMTVDESAIDASIARSKIGGDAAEASATHALASNGTESGWDDHLPFLHFPSLFSRPPSSNLHIPRELKPPLFLLHNGCW